MRNFSGTYFPVFGLNMEIYIEIVRDNNTNLNSHSDNSGMRENDFISDSI